MSDEHERDELQQLQDGSMMTWSRWTSQLEPRLWSCQPVGPGVLEQVVFAPEGVLRTCLYALSRTGW